MNRSDFLKILAGTPFAIKSLIMTHGKEHIEKSSDSIEEVKSINENSFLFSHNGKEFGISKSGNFNIYNDRISEGIYQQTWDIEFQDMVCYDGFDPFHLIDNKEQITVEIYRGEKGFFNTCEGFLNEIEIDYFSNTYSGVIYCK